MMLACRLALVVWAACALSCAAHVPLLRAAPATPATPATETELKAARDRARRAPANEAYAQWLEVGRLALAQLPRDGSTPEPAKGTRSILLEALGRLSPTGHAALAAHGRRPEISEAFVRALASRRDTAEVRAECRDGLARWGPILVPGLVEAWQKLGPAGGDAHSAGTPIGRRAGGVTRTIYRVGFVNRSSKGTPEERIRWEMAFWAGLGVAVGGRVEEFSPRPFELEETLEWATIAAVSMDLSGVGAIVLGVEGPALPASLSLGSAIGIPGLSVTGTGPPESHVDSTTYGAPVLFCLTPSARAQARLLLEHARSQGARRMVLALPPGGGDEALAAAIEDQAGDVSVERYEYAPGRRDFAPEVRAITSRGADALVLLGPGEESGEWLLALRAAGVRLLVLGTEELDPQGFHERVRVAAEGIAYVGRDYILSEKERSGIGAQWIADDPLFRRYYLAGRALGESVAAGAFTPGSLRESLSRRAWPRHTLAASLEWSREVASVSLHRIQGGQAVRLR